MADETTLQDPLQDSAKAALYFNTNLPAGHPEREAVKAEVERYYQAKYPEHGSETLDYQEPSATSQGQETSNPDAEYWQTAPVSPEFIASIQEDLEAAASEYGHTDSLDTWVAFAKGIGQAEAADALIELTTIAEQWPDGAWRGDPETRARVYELNQVVDRARLAWASSRVGRR